MKKVTISLSEQEKNALIALAEKERRDPRAQASLIIRQNLERRGLLAGQPIKGGANGNCD